MEKRRKFDWYVHDRFGMFIHWGIYSLPARHEWVQRYEYIPCEEYLKYFEHFNPVDFNPNEWARLAVEAGMKYLVITTKHHDGFCLWDSQYTDYKVTNTPFGRDALREVVDAFRAQNIHIGLYYSLLDWHHPDFTVDDIHVLKLKENRDELNQGRDMARYREYMFNQVREILTNYGKIDLLFFDFSYPHIGRDGKGRKDWDSPALVQMVRQLQPDILINDRLDYPDSADIITPEQVMLSEPPRKTDGSIAVWEGCHTFSGSWGYYRDETTWKTSAQCIELLINNVCLGGNLLMNVGPSAKGNFDPRAVSRLQSFAAWMKANHDSIYGCTMAPAEFPEPRDCRYTWNPEKHRLYLHIMNWPFEYIRLVGLKNRIKYMQFLHDASEIREISQAIREHNNLMTPTDEHSAIIKLPVIKPPVEIPVIEIFLKE
ncbi:MAG: alpha-L-fucosidase [Oligosphaeraceae bacterium]|nr:alpha-L-fucosidase [Oligosphaeraceae bacterium]